MVKVRWWLDKKEVIGARFGDDRGISCCGSIDSKLRRNWDGFYFSVKEERTLNVSSGEARARKLAHALHLACHRAR